MVRCRIGPQTALQRTLSAQGDTLYDLHFFIQRMPETEKALLQLSEYSSLYKYGVLFVNKNKLNKWILQFLIDIYGYDSLRALIALKGKKNKRCLYSVHSYMKHIENYLKL